MSKEQFSGAEHLSPRERLAKMPDATATFFRHGKPRYSMPELISGQLEGEIKPEVESEVREAAEALAKSIDKDNELVVMWASPKSRAQRTSEIVREEFERSGIPFLQDKDGNARATKTVDMVRDLYTAGDVEKGSPFWDKLIAAEKEGVLLPSGEPMGIANWQESLKVLSEQEGFEDLEAESAEHIAWRTKMVLKHLDSIARKIKGPDGKRLRFVIFGHEEIMTPVLEAAFDQGTVKGTGPGYAESMTVGVNASSSESPAKLAVSFKGKKANLDFNPKTKELLLAAE